MISWIKGEIISSWLQNQKLVLLVSCQGVGYEIQTLNSVEAEFNEKNITLWIEHIRREDSEFLFGFVQKEERDFFRDLLKVRGIGPQIGMSLLNKHDLNQIFSSLRNKDKALFNSIPGIGEKMTERLFLEFKNKITVTPEITKDFAEKLKNPQQKKEIINLIDDLDLALKSLSYSLKERKKAINLILTKIDQSNLPIQKVLNSFTFEVLLKDSLDFLDKNR